MARYYYSATFSEFRDHAPVWILGELTQHHGFALETLQKHAWLEEIEILKTAVAGLPEGHLLLEYSIPRMGKRVDAVLLVAGLVLIVEFKIGETAYTRAAIDQAMDYALDLKNFHAQSHTKRIVPIVMASAAPAATNQFGAYPDDVMPALRANRQTFGSLLAELVAQSNRPKFDPIEWRDAAYKPTPTIIEAAQALYRGHHVEEISRSDADPSEATEAVFGIIEDAKANRRKAIVFVTGVPGAGKTLAGLNIATERQRLDVNEHAVFLSGNGPLVIVLREALAQDEFARSQAQPIRITKAQAKQKVRAFIQNIHHFRDDALNTARAPDEHVAVFDEAQRAWDREATANFMKQKRGVPAFDMSEPRFLMSVLDRHDDWAVIVCLVGGGQEINTGEAGLTEWLETIARHYAHWQVHVSPHLSGAEYLDGRTAADFIAVDRLHINNRLHLRVSVRSFRAERQSALVQAVLEGASSTAADLLSVITPRYPIAVTRDLGSARAWLRARARGSERYGLLASSGALRLRPLGVSVKDRIDVIHWFLRDATDVRSSFALEQAATEFEVQGLELDWTAVLWDGDLRRTTQGWQTMEFAGSRWNRVANPMNIRYLVNAYRVLLTRARQGMIIVVPEGNPNDATRLPAFYDSTYAYLRAIGFPPV